MSRPASIAGAAFLAEDGVQRLLSALSRDGDLARIAGGAVRNALLGEPIGDVDVATTTEPAQTMARAKAAGFRTIPTGIEHGTVTVIADGRPIEVTTLRADVETDGRHARVVFGRDWRRDAERRDFTMNALYADADGTVVDLVGGLADVERHNLRFIGDAEQRIREDYLRILRFFRFFAHYGAGRPDAEGLRACARLKDGLDGLSAERVWQELKKLLGARDPGRALLWMRQTGVLTRVLPESEKWGIDLVGRLVASEAAMAWPPDALLRLEAIVPPRRETVAALASRLKLSNAERRRLADWADAPEIDAGTGDLAFAKLLYRAGADGIADRLRLALAAQYSLEPDAETMQRIAGLSRLLRAAMTYERPAFPLRGEDLKEMGFAAGPALGAALRALEAQWIDSGFTLDVDTLKTRAAALGAG